MPENINRREPVTGHTTHTTRVKDAHQEHNDMLHGVSENTKGFYDELSEKFPEIRVTSGKRDKSPSGGFSHHHTGDALDIGAEHTDVYEYLNNTKEGLALMDKYGMGILDETDPRNMQKTHATGPHFHIGKDTGLYKNTKNRYNQVDHIQPVYSFASKNPDFDYSNLDNIEGADLQLTGQHATQQQTVEIEPDMVGADDRLGATFRVVVPNKQTANAFVKEVEKEQKKEEVKDSKLAKSEARQLLKQKEAEEEAKIEAVFNTMGMIRQRDAESQERITKKTETPYKNTTPIDIQQGLPQLPSIFKS